MDGMAGRVVESWLRRVAVTWVNHAGAPLVKVVHRRHVDLAVDIGVGFSPVADAFRTDGLIAESHCCARPDEDLRLHLVGEALVPLDADLGWGWAPGERRWRDGRDYEADQRSFCRRQQESLKAESLELQVGFELEWTVALAGQHGELLPAFPGGPYGADRLVEGFDYATELLDALDAAGLDWMQFHPEYATSQFELSLAHASPTEAADRLVLARLVIYRVSTSLGLRCSFAPKISEQQAGNGGHLHLSVKRHGVPLLHGGSGPGGLTADGEALVAGLLDALPMLMPIACPLASSYLRLAPSAWSAPFQVWGVENREAALRLVPMASDQISAHLEVKSADLGANPYLLMGSLQAVAAEAIAHPRPLPEPVFGDPVLAQTTDSAHRRLPRTLEEALAVFSSSTVLREAMGEHLHSSLMDSVRAEISRCEGMTSEEVIASTRWWPLVGGLQ